MKYNSTQILMFKNALNALNKYNYYSSIFDCYKRPSNAKIKAFMQCEYLADNAFATKQGIINYNSQSFTYAFIYELKGIHYLVYITSRNQYEIKIGELI